eukprot:gene12821-17082_t
MFSDLEKKFFGKSPDQLGAAERKVLKLTRERKLLASNASEDFLADSTTGQRLADAIARIGGSWGFIIFFGLFLLFWVSINTVILWTRAFDPYPFIFLNLLLSMIAAIQAPIIMMSQNRQAQRDRFMAAKYYEINLKAEIEVLGLHQKSDLQRAGHSAAAASIAAELALALIEQQRDQQVFLVLEMPHQAGKQAFRLRAIGIARPRQIGGAAHQVVIEPVGRLGIADEQRVDQPMV